MHASSPAAMFHRRENLDGEVRVWPIRSEDLLVMARRRLQPPSPKEEEAKWHELIDR